MPRKVIIAAIYAAMGLLSLLPSGAFAQTSRGGRITEGTLAARPGCPIPTNPGDFYVANDQTPVVVAVCSSTGWTSVGGASLLIQTNGSSNTSQATLNFITSTTNAIGLTVTPSNPASGNQKFEVTGVYNGNAATATALASTPTLCGGSQVAQGVLANGNATGCLTPGGSPAGSTNDTQYNAGGGAFGAAANGKTGQSLISTNGAAPGYQSPGLADGNGGAAVTTTPYTIQCDSGTALIDRGKLLRFQGGASVVTVPQSSASGCTGNFVVSVVDESAGTLTFNRTGADTFSVYNAASSSTAQTSFTLSNGQYATLSQGAGTVWEVRVAAIGGITTIGFGNNVVVAGVKQGGSLLVGTGNVTSGSPNFSSTAAQWDSSMVGYLIRANGQATGNDFAVGTTVLSVTDPTHAVASANSNRTATTEDIALFPRDETATINTAIAAAFSIANCGSVIIPRGTYLITTTFSALNAGLPAGCTSFGNGAGPFFQIGGFPETVQGKGTTLVMPVDFDWTTCTTSSVCFPFLHPTNFNFHGMDFNALPVAAQNKIVTNSSGYNFGIHSLGSPSITGFTSFQLNGNGGSCLRCFFDNTGPVDWNGFFGTFSGYIEGTAYMRVGSSGNLQISSNGTEIDGIEFYGAAAQVYCSQGARLSASSIGGNSVIVKWSASGGSVYLDGCTLPPTSVTNAFLASGANTGTIHATHMAMSGTITNFMNGNIAFFDDCGNTFTGGLGSWTGKWYGSCSITGTTQTTGNIALTSGWDTSTKSGISGNSQREQFTITAAGAPSASPVITITYPTPFLVAPTCTFIQTGGTFGTLTNPSIGTPTVTSVAITLAGTPVAAQTYTFVLDCSN